MLLLRDCRALPEAGHSGLVDILVRDGRIESIGPGLAADGAQVVEGRGRLAVPGLVNAHLHSSEVLLRGRYDGLSFDAWGLYVYPLFRPGPLPPRLIYLRTALVALESLRSGVTCVVDDVADETLSMDALSAVFEAYLDAGIRCSCSGNVMDQDPFSGLPFAGQVLTEDARARLAHLRFPSPADYRAFAQEAIARFHDPAGLSRYVVAPVAPQWCSEEMLATCVELAEAHDLNLLIHVLETKAQAITSRSWGEGGFVGHLRRHGALRPSTTIAHGVWLQDEELDTLAEVGCAVAHNPIANLRLGVGVARVSAMRERGIAVGLGTDGLAINDRVDLFEVMRSAALLSRSLSPDPGRWLLAEDVLEAGTRGGARCAHLEGEVGELRPGARADLALLRCNGPDDIGREQAVNQLVYSASPESVELVVVDGRVVLQDGICPGIDEPQILAELAEYALFFGDWQREVEARNAVFRPLVEEIHARCVAVDIGFTRWGDGGDRGAVRSTTEGAGMNTAVAMADPTNAGR